MSYVYHVGTCDRSGAVVAVSGAYSSESAAERERASSKLLAEWSVGLRYGEIREALGPDVLDNLTREGWALTFTPRHTYVVLKCPNGDTCPHGR